MKEGIRIRVQQIDHYIRLVLRGKMWIVFINRSRGVQFDFNEDVMYMHLFCRLPDEQLREIVESRGLDLDPRTRRIEICRDDILTKVQQKIISCFFKYEKDSIFVALHTFGNYCYCSPYYIC